MKDHEIDRILSEEEILPSSGFTASVMDAILREASAPPPIPFPWKRALPGLVGVGLSLVLALVLFLVHPARFAGPPLPLVAWIGAQGTNMAVQEWRSIGIALLVIVFSVIVPLRVASRRG